MDSETLLKQMKTLKAKARAAGKEGKKEVAVAFKNGASRLLRKVKSMRPRGSAIKSS